MERRKRAVAKGDDVLLMPAGEVRRTGRQTMGVRLINLPEDTSVVGIAHNAEAEHEAAES